VGARVAWARGGEVALAHLAPASRRVAAAAPVCRPGVGAVVALAADEAAPPSADDLDRTCLDAIARFKRPKGYRFVDSLPTKNYGKVLKRELRDRLRAETS
jgi:acyl-CoA synthetase (AMP-forming)/AMP-acid ligase II